MKPVGEGSKGKKNRKQSVSALLPVAKTTDFLGKLPYAAGVPRNRVQLAFRLGEV